MRSVPDEEIIAAGFNLEYVIDAYNRLGIGDKFFTPFFEKLVGVDYVRGMIESGHSATEICARWQENLKTYKALQRKYLLYEE